MKSKIVCPKDCIDLVNKIHFRTKSYPKTAGIMLKQYKVKIELYVQDPITGLWHK